MGMQTRVYFLFLTCLLELLIEILVILRVGFFYPKKVEGDWNGPTMREAVLRSPEHSVCPLV